MKRTQDLDYAKLAIQNNNNDLISDISMCSSNFATNPYGIKNTNIQVQKNSNQPK